MSQATAGFRAAIAHMREWQFVVEEQPGAWGANNGLTEYANGNPDAHVNHHFVCSLNPAPAYRQSMVDMLRNGYDQTPGPVVPAFIDMMGVLYFIADGPANHAGQGASSVLNRVRNDQAPLGPAANVGATDDGVKNNHYSGTETQHPGDGTPYPQALITALVAWNAAQALAFGWSNNRAIHHYESTSRKDDMSWRGGVNGDGGPHLRALVGAWMAAAQHGVNLSPATDPESLLADPTSPTQEDDPMAALTQKDWNEALDAYFKDKATAGGEMVAAVGPQQQVKGLAHTNLGTLAVSNKTKTEASVNLQSANAALIRAIGKTTAALAGRKA